MCVGYSPSTWDVSARYWVSKWQDHVKNVDIAAMTGLPNIANARDVTHCSVTSSDWTPPHLHTKH